MNLEKQLYSLINSTRVLTSTRNLNLVLRRLIKEVLQVIEAGEAGVLFLFDHKKVGLIPKSSVGFDEKYLKQIILFENEGMTGKTYFSKKATIFSYLPDTSEGMSNLRPSNHDLYIKALGKLKYPTSTICTPLNSEHGCLGVLMIDSFSNDITFTENDLHILEIFANQAMIAIENAKLFSQNERAQKIHTELSRVSLSQKGLKEITITLSKLIDKKVCIVNEFFDFISSCSETTRSLAIDLKQSNRESLIEAINRHQFLQKTINLNGQNYDVFFFPIKALTSTIGLLIIFVEKEEMDPLDIFAVEHAMILFALEMTSEERFIANRYKYEGFLLEQLMKNRFEVLDKQSEMYFSEMDRYIFVKVEMLTPFISFEENNLLKEKFSRFLYRELNYFEFKSLILEENMEFNILFIIKNPLDEQKIIEKMKLFFSKINLNYKEINNIKLFVGIGRVFTQLHQIKISLHDSNKCIDFLKLNGREQTIYSYNDLGVHRLLLNVNPLELKNYVQDILSELILYDQKNGTELLTTLKRYFECDQNLKETADKCFVHLNTIKYRLQTIKKILNLENITSETSFQLQFALYVYEFLY